MGAIDRLQTWGNAQPALGVLTMVVRVLLALAFVPSGLVKILDQPFTTLPVTDPVGYFFAGFFSAHGYYRFIGVAQWTAAALLLIPRTATLGAFLYLPIIINVFVINVAIGPSFAGTRVVTGAMLLGNLYLLVWDWDRWKRILSTASPAHERHGDGLIALGLLVAAGVGLQGLIGANLARLGSGSFAWPLMLIMVAAVLGVAMLVTAYKRARRPSVVGRAE